MKINLISVLLIFLTYSFFGQSLELMNTEYYIGEPRNENWISIEKNKLTYYENSEKVGVFQYLLTLDNNGFENINFTNKKLIVLDSKSEPFMHDLSNPEFNYKLKFSEGFRFLNHGIDSIKSNRFLKETLNGKEIEYSSANLTQLYFGDAVGDNFWNYEHIPFAVRSNDIPDTELIIKFKTPSKSFFILNGYVDLQRRSLYKENSRIKELQISYLSEGLLKTEQVELKDVPSFQMINLNVNLTTINIKIVSVYEGSKFEDLCISYIGLK